MDNRVDCAMSLYFILSASVRWHQPIWEQVTYRGKRKSANNVHTENVRKIETCSNSFTGGRNTVKGHCCIYIWSCLYKSFVRVRIVRRKKFYKKISSTGIGNRRRKNLSLRTNRFRKIVMAVISAIKSDASLVGPTAGRFSVFGFLLVILYRFNCFLNTHFACALKLAKKYAFKKPHCNHRVKSLMWNIFSILSQRYFRHCVQIVNYFMCK